MVQHGQYSSGLEPSPLKADHRSKSEHRTALGTAEIIEIRLAHSGLQACVQRISSIASEAAESPKSRVLCRSSLRLAGVVNVHVNNRNSCDTMQRHEYSILCLHLSSYLSVYLSNKLTDLPIRQNQSIYLSLCVSIYIIVLPFARPQIHTCANVRFVKL